ncbi:MAG TPA: hypothetical protein VJU18_14580, partial [Vicinamibacteria bacterium]|nr:hypothetical protein [Vicinamibacteria bacterium]
MSQTNRRRKAWVRFLLWGLVVLALFLVAAAASFWRRPLSVLEAMGRFGLRSSGFTRLTLAAPRGPLVYWRGGAGNTVILLHGANDYAGAWAKVAGP